MATTAALDNLSAGARMRRQREILAAADAAPNTESALAAIDETLREFVPFDAGCWFSTDPATELGTWPVLIRNIEAGHCTTYWEREFLVEDTNLFTQLTRASRPAASLQSATGGLVERSARYREFMRPQGFSDELRAALRSGGSTWGLLALMRYDGQASFTPEEVDFLDDLSAPLADVIRTKVIQETLPTMAHHPGPGLLMFDADGSLISLNDAARGWMAQLPHRVVDEVDMPVAVFTVLAHARAVARGHQRGTARVRALSTSGQWLVVYASNLTGPDGEDASARQTAVVIEPATRMDIMPIIIEAYQLSAREQQVVSALARGLSTAEMAAEFYLSQHTVRDHLKAIFAKVGVSSRGELVAMLYSQHYAPDIHQRLGQP